jgi:hypothetical protein
VLAQGQRRTPRQAPISNQAPDPRSPRKNPRGLGLLDTLSQGGGAALSLENADGSVFDAIVFGERQPGKWTAGSDGFSTHPRPGGTRGTRAPAGGHFVHVAIAYHADNRIAVYRNGQPYGEPYTARHSPPDLQGRRGPHRHRPDGTQGGGRPWLTGAIRHAALYDRALTPAEVAASFQARGTGITTAERPRRPAACRNRSRHTKPSARITAIRTELADLDKPRNPSPTPADVTQPAPTRVLKRGDVKSPGDTVAPGALSAVSIPDPGLRPGPRRPRSPAPPEGSPIGWPTRAIPCPRASWPTGSGMFHFGQGLVATPERLRRQRRASHPPGVARLAGRPPSSRAAGASRPCTGSICYVRHLPPVRRAPRRSAMALDADNPCSGGYTPRASRSRSRARRHARRQRPAQPPDGRPQLPSVRPFSRLPANAYVPTTRPGPEFNRRTVYRMNVNSGKGPLDRRLRLPGSSGQNPAPRCDHHPIAGARPDERLVRPTQSARTSPRPRPRGTPARILAAAIQAAYRLALGRPAKPEETRNAPRRSARERGLDQRLLGVAQLHRIRLCPLTGIPLPTPPDPTHARTPMPHSGIPDPAATTFHLAYVPVAWAASPSPGS